MFNVTRTYPAPDSIARGHYNKEDVLQILKPMFFEKCYLCERDDIQDVEVEHFVPHQSNEALKYDWDNLYYSCSRCNSIKSNSHINLLDCTDSNIDVSKMIRFLIPSVPDGKVTVEATATTPCDKTNNTVALLDACYNLDNTALRGISRETLMEQMWEYFTELLIARQTLRKKNSGKTEKQNAEETIEAMLDVKHPFSIFWRYYYLSDTFLTQNYPNLRIGL